MGLKEGDKIDISIQNGVINIIPVVVYPKKYVEDLKNEILDVKKKIITGEQPTFDSVDHDILKQF